MKKLLFFILSLLFSYSFMQAQNEQGKALRRCGTAYADSIRQANDPVYKAQREATEKYVEKWVAEHPNYEPKTTVIIPLVVHVIYQTGNTAEQISVSRVKDNINETNADWAGLSVHSMNAFSNSLKANTGVQFCLAVKDPSGAATTGVTYTQTTVTSFNDMSGTYPERSSSTGGCDAWDVTKYLNVWVCDMGSQLCGISKFPSNPNSNQYGTTINYVFFGNSTDGAEAPYNLGGTLSHELGHCFDLYHTWGDRGNNACSVTTYPGSDLCSDTPPQYTATYGAHTGVLTDQCSSSAPGIIYEDFMDYTDDIDYACFTPDQVLRIQAIVALDDASLVTAETSVCAVGIIEKEEISNINIYPNPSNGLVNVMFNMADKNNVTISVNNLLGDVISKIEKENVSSVNIPIDLSTQSVGVYFIKIQSGNSTLTRKIVLFR